MDQLDWASGFSRAPKASAGAPRGRRAAAAKAPTKQAAAAPSTGLTKTSVRAVFAKAQPTNHEQRILLLALAAEQSAAEAFTTSEVTANAREIGVTSSTIPGSLSKLKKAGMLSTTRSGRSAYYALTAKGRELAERMARGEVVSSRRGRKPSAKKAGAVKAAAKPGRPAKKKPGPKPKAAASATAPSTATASPKKRGPKPGAKAAAKKAATTAPAAKGAAKSAPKKRGPAKGSPRPSATLASLPEEDRKVAEKMVGAAVNADEKARFEKLKAPRDRALYILQRFGNEVASGMSASLISCVLKTRHGVNAPANGVGAALKKTLPSKLVAQNAEGRYNITVDGRNYLEGTMSK
jgi:DNA-binding PadR family transcriptional regulator